MPRSVFAAQSQQQVVPQQQTSEQHAPVQVQALFVIPDSLRGVATTLRFDTTAAGVKVQVDPAREASCQPCRSRRSGRWGTPEPTTTTDERHFELVGLCLWQFHGSWIARNAAFQRSIRPRFPSNLLLGRKLDRRLPVCPQAVVGSNPTSGSRFLLRVHARPAGKPAGLFRACDLRHCC